jgi:hypothetical protein
MSGNRPSNVPSDILAKRDGVTSAPPRREPIPKTADIPPFWQFKPPFGIDFYFNTTGTLAAGAGSTLVLTGNPAVQLTPDYEGVIGGMQIFVDAPTALINVVWSVLFNNSPVPGWSSLTTFPRAANSISIEFGGPLQVPANTLITVLATNNAASGPWTVGAEVTGWSWPIMKRIWTFGE